MTKWFYKHGDKASGPVDELALREWIKQKSVRPEQLIRREGEEQWQRADSFPELWGEYAPPAPQPIPLIEQLRALRSEKPIITYIIAVLYGIAAYCYGARFACIYLGGLVVIFTLQSFNDRRNRRQMDLLAQLVKELEEKEKS